MENIGLMSEQAKEVRNDYLRKWRRRNPDKMRAYNIAYWERKAEDLQEWKAESINQATRENFSTEITLDLK